MVPEKEPQNGCGGGVITLWFILWAVYVNPQPKPKCNKSVKNFWHNHLNILLKNFT